MLDGFGVLFDRVEIPNWDRSEVIRLTNGEYYQVPVIEHDGRIVFETADNPYAVPRYLDEHLLNRQFFPEKNAGIHEIVLKNIEDDLEGIAFKLCDIYYVDSIEDIAHRVAVIRHKERKFGPGCVEQWKRDRELLLETLVKALHPYETALAQSQFLFGDSPIYADFALYGVLGNFQFNPENNLPENLTNLIRWENEIGNYSVR